MASFHRFKNFLCPPRLHLNATFVKGRHVGLPLQKSASLGTVGVNLRVRPGEGEGGIEAPPGAIGLFNPFRVVHFNLWYFNLWFLCCGFYD